MTVLLITPQFENGGWLDGFKAVSGGRGIAVHDEPYDPADIRYAMAFRPPHGLLATLPRLEVIFGLGAGVDGILADPDLPAVPLVRLVDPDLTERMAEWVVLQVLTHHRRAPAYAEQQRERRWHELPQPVASEVFVGLMGFGTLAAHAAVPLRQLGFRVHGWARTPRPDAPVPVASGAEALPGFLELSDILVCLLPLTDATREILDASLIARLPQTARGPVLINAGRGGLQVEADILAALADGTLKGASLDVFEQEPLPGDSPLWQAQNLVITPHVAAVSDPVSTMRAIVRQIDAYERGEPLQNVVRPDRGY